MASKWKLLGVAGLAGVAATGAVVVRQRRQVPDVPPDELRAKLHERLAEAQRRDAGVATPKP